LIPAEALRSPDSNLWLNEPGEHLGFAFSRRPAVNGGGDGMEPVGMTGIGQAEAWQRACDR